MKKQFEICNKMANINLNNKGNLSEFLVRYLGLAQGLGKSEIAYEALMELPPAEAFNNPDMRVDMVVSACAQELERVKQNNIEENLGFSKVA